MEVCLRFLRRKRHMHPFHSMMWFNGIWRESCIHININLFEIKIKSTRNPYCSLWCGIFSHVDDGGGGWAGISISSLCWTLNWRYCYIRHMLMLMVIPTGHSIELLIVSMPLHYTYRIYNTDHHHHHPVVSRVHRALRAEPEHSRLIYLNHNDIILFWKYNLF